MISPASPAGTIALSRHGRGPRLGLRVVLAETLEESMGKGKGDRFIFWDEQAK
jgi:hypothetical protein